MGLRLVLAGTAPAFTIGKRPKSNAPHGILFASNFTGADIARDCDFKEFLADSTFGLIRLLVTPHSRVTLSVTLSTGLFSP